MPGHSVACRWRYIDAYRLLIIYDLKYSRRILTNYCSVPAVRRDYCSTQHPAVCSGGIAGALVHWAALDECDAAATRCFAALRVLRRAHAYVRWRWQRLRRDPGPSGCGRRSAPQSAPLGGAHTSHLAGDVHTWQPGPHRSHCRPSSEREKPGREVRKGRPIWRPFLNRIQKNDIQTRLKKTTLKK